MESSGSTGSGNAIGVTVLAVLTAATAVAAVTIDRRVTYALAAACVVVAVVVVRGVRERPAAKRERLGREGTCPDSGGTGQRIQDLTLEVGRSACVTCGGTGAAPGRGVWGAEGARERLRASGPGAVETPGPAAPLCRPGSDWTLATGPIGWDRVRRELSPWIAGGLGVVLVPIGPRQRDRLRDAGDQAGAGFRTGRPGVPRPPPASRSDRTSTAGPIGESADGGSIGGRS